MTNKLEEGDKALVVGPLGEERFLPLPFGIVTVPFIFYSVVWITVSQTTTNYIDS